MVPQKIEHFCVMSRFYSSLEALIHVAKSRRGTKQSRSQLPDVYHEKSVLRTLQELF